jgi:predicted Zn-dependent protease with MMP-like domain
VNAVDGERFQDLVREALDDLPRWIQERLDNVDVLIEDSPPRGRRNLLGLYEGVPLTHRGANYFGVLPDRITLFRSTIERAARNEADVKRVVKRTVVHEFAHFFGISDERLREIDRY